MNRFFYWLYRFLYRFKVYLTRRFTRAGLFLLTLLVLAAFFGADTTLSTIFQVFAFIAFLLLFAFLFSLRVKGRFEVQRKLPRFATAGLPFYYGVSIKNPFKRPCDNLHVVDELEDTKITFQEFRQLKIPTPRSWMAGGHKQGLSRWAGLLAYKKGAPQMAQKQISLGPHEVQDVRLKMRPVRRGRIRLTGTNLARTDPLMPASLKKGRNPSLYCPNATFCRLYRYPAAANTIPAALL
jgi:uncharacterized protein (DUF58 family)